MDPETRSGRRCVLSKHSGHSNTMKAGLHRRYRGLNGVSLVKLDEASKDAVYDRVSNAVAAQLQAVMTLGLTIEKVP